MKYQQAKKVKLKQNIDMIRDFYHNDFQVICEILP